jgi:hypothetical protein
LNLNKKLEEKNLFSWSIRFITKILSRITPVLRK